MQSTDIRIVSAVRTPIGSLNGSLSSLKAHELGGIAIREALCRANIQSDQVCQVIMGQALTAGQGQNPARQAAMKATIPYTVPSFLVNMLCGSGLKSVVLGCQAIKAGDANIVVCGGQESMSQAPHCTHLRKGVKMGPCTMVDTMVVDGLTDAFHNIHMGVTAENIIKSWNITREEQDEFAVKSQKKAADAVNEGYFKKEIVPVTIKERSGETVVTVDEYPRPETSIEKLKKLKPAFIQNGSVTAGNASGINDGAAAIVLMSAEEATARHIESKARIVSYAECGVEPEIMGTGPIPAVKLALEKAGWSKEVVDLFEINEAFASQSIAVIRDLGVDPSKVNINGGAIALGHPIGASGTRILVTLLHALERTGGKRGVAALCIGGGMGIAMCVERA